MAASSGAVRLLAVRPALRKYPCQSSVRLTRSFTAAEAVLPVQPREGAHSGNATGTKFGRELFVALSDVCSHLRERSGRWWWRRSPDSYEPRCSRSLVILRTTKARDTPTSPSSRERPTS